MDDRAMYRLLENVMQPLFALHPSLNFVQSRRGHEVPALSGPAVIMTKLLDLPRGWPERRWTKSDDKKKVEWYETQQYETTVQITFEIDVGVDTATASDVANYTRALLLGVESDDIFAAANSGRFLVQQIIDPAFVNDRDENVGSPNFDLTITHRRSRKLDLPAANRARLAGIYRI